jgi:predicted dehydrogenase
MWAPKLEIREALAVECDHFAECVRKLKKPLSDGEAGLSVVRLLEAASKSMAAHGQQMPV